MQFGSGSVKTDDFDYYLPEELIAQTPLEKRDDSKLMILDKKTGEIIFYSLTYLIPKYPKLDIELGEVKNDGIYSYSIKEDITDEKKQLLGMDFYNKISKIYNKQDVLFANSY